MKINRHKLLHYVLIILMMFAPLRGVMAMQQTHCDVGNHIAGHDAESSAVISAYSGDHEMMDMSVVANTSVQKSVNSHSCCSGSHKCVSNCADMSISASLLMQELSYTPNFTNVSGSVALTTDLINREFTPPFRPPLVTHS